jgi:hypothetical protein
MNEITMTHEKWVDKYKPIENHFNGEEGSYNNTLFEIYGQEVEHVKKQNSNNIWTLIYGENENVYIVSGWHIVNREGYFITEHSFNDNENITVNDNEMINIKDAIEVCVNFFKTIDVELDFLSVHEWFTKSIYYDIDNPEMTIGDAKYCAIEFFEYLGNDLTLSQQDKIHDYYLNLN